MAEIPEHLKHYFANIDELRRIMEQANTKLGFVPVEGVTSESVRQSMRKNGIRAEDNVFTCLLYKMRDGEDEG
jgi:hypothetical protein